MSILDQLGGILSQYAGAGQSTGQAAGQQATEHFQQVATQVPQQDLSRALTGVFQSTETGTFGQNISSLFGQSNPNQRAGILNQLAQYAEPAVLSRLGLGGAPGAISPAQAQQVAPEHVEELANHAQQQNPNVVQEAGDFYSQHPTLVKALGAGAAIFALRHFAAGQ